MSLGRISKVWFTITGPLLKLCVLPIRYRIDVTAEVILHEPPALFVMVTLSNPVARHFHSNCSPRSIVLTAPVHLRLCPTTLKGFQAG